MAPRGFLKVRKNRRDREFEELLWMFKSLNKMAPRGFEPPTPGLRVQYSDRAELRGLDKMIEIAFIKFYNDLQK